jgi:hypothetical protein
MQFRRHETRGLASSYYLLHMGYILYIISLDINKDMNVRTQCVHTHMSTHTHHQIVLDYGYLKSPTGMVLDLVNNTAFVGDSKGQIWAVDMDFKANENQNVSKVLNKPVLLFSGPISYGEICPNCDTGVVIKVNNPPPSPPPSYFILSSSESLERYTHSLWTSLHTCTHIYNIHFACFRNQRHLLWTIDIASSIKHRRPLLSTQ